MDSARAAFKAMAAAVCEGDLDGVASSAIVVADTAAATSRVNCRLQQHAHAFVPKITAAGQAVLLLRRPGFLAAGSNWASGSAATSATSEVAREIRTGWLSGVSA